MKTQKLITSLLFMAILSIAISVLFAVNPFILFGVLFTVSLFNKKQAGVLTLTIDASDVVTQFGAHYIDEGQNLSKIISLPYAASKTRALFRMIPQIGDYFKSSTAQLDSVLQPFQKGFTSKGNIEFKPNAFPLFRTKIDMSIFPDDIIQSYLGFLAGIPTNDRTQWPIVRYIMEVHIPKASDNDWEKKISFGGKYVVPTANVASPAEETLDGIKAVLKKYNTAGKLNLENGPLAMGALAADDQDFCVQVELWVDSMTPELRDEIDFINMSQVLAVKYKRGKRKIYGKDVNFVDATGKSGLLTIEDYPQISVNGLQSHNGSSLIWATTEMNRIRPTWRSQLENGYKIETQKREVSIYTDWYEALEFNAPQLVITNDSADLN